MATSALLAIGKAAAGPLLNKLKNDIMGNKYGDASAAVQAILDAQKISFEKLEHKIDSVISQQALDQQFTLIGGWTVLLREGLLKKKNGSEDALKTLYDAINNPSTGVLHSLMTIDDVLRGSASAYSNAAALDLYQDKIYRDLESENMSYTIASYLQSVCDHLEAHIILQGTALMLRIAAADQYDDTAKWERELGETLKRQIDHAYRKLPAFIRKMKSSFDAPMHVAHWWRFKETNGRKWLERNFTIFGKMTNGFDRDTDGPAPKSEWRFHPALDQPGQIRIQTRTDKAFIAAFYSAGTYTYPYGSSAGGWTVSFNGSEANNLVKCKVVPLRTNEPRFRFIVPQDGPRNMEPFRNDWEINDDGVGQWE